MGQSGHAPRAVVVALLLLYGWTDQGAAQDFHHSLQDLDDLPIWALDDPDLRIGAIDGPDEYQLFQAGAIRILSDGSIAVNQFGSAEVRIYDRRGTHLRSLGGPGSGPGEFRQLTRLFRLGADSLITWDPGQARGPVYSVDGSYGRQLNTPSGPGRSWLEGVFEDRSLLIASRDLRVQARGQRRQTVIHLFRATRDGVVTDTLGDRLGFELTGSGGGWTNILFGGQGFAVAGGGLLWLSEEGEPRVERRTLKGDLVGVTSWEVKDREVSAEEIERYWADYVARGPEFEESAKTRRNLPVAEQFPATIGAFGGADGYLWISEYPRPSKEGEQSWLVVDRSGRIIARMKPGGGFTLREVADGFAYGYTRDEFDVQYLERRRILGPQTAWAQL